MEAARETSATAGHVALAWVLSQEGVSSAIVGPHTRKQLKENLGALDVTLDATTMAALDES